MTRRLYEEDAYRREFEGRVKRCVPAGDGWEVVLDQTAFYPEGGGQPCDLGQLGEAEVSDVQEREGEIFHRCSSPFGQGTVVHGRIDWGRRLTHMREHSGEHILSGIICRTHGCSNVGFHMGKECVTVDFSVLLTPEQIREAERAANDKVLENVEITATYPGAEELEALEYRSKKALEGPVRIVTIPGADVCACCGTHVRRTGEVGPIKVIGSEKFKGGSRLQLLIGEKALADYGERFESIQKISALLSAKPGETALAVEKLQRAENELKLALGALKMRLLEEKAESVPEKTACSVIFEQGLTPVDVRRLADRLAKRAAFAAVFNGCDGEGYQYVMCASGKDIVAFGREFNQALQGRGGGREPMIQGYVGAVREEIQDYLQRKGVWNG